MTRTAEPRAAQARRFEAARLAAGWFAYAAEPARLAVILMLERGEAHAGALGVDPAALSHHLAQLRHGGIVDRRRQGQNVFYALTGSGRVLAGLARELGA